MTTTIIKLLKFNYVREKIRASRGENKSTLCAEEKRLKMIANFLVKTNTEEKKGNQHL